MAPEPPGGAVNPGYIYKYNFRPFSGANLLGPIIGGAEAVVAAYRDLLEAGTPGQSKDDVQTQLRLAESEAEVGAAGVLQQRIEALSIRRRRLQALEWVGGKEKEGIEAKA